MTSRTRIAGIAVGVVALALSTSVAFATGPAPTWAGDEDLPPAERVPVDMLGMHDAMHAAYPEMDDHMADLGIDPDEMRGWMSDTVPWGEMHDGLTDDMHADTTMTGHMSWSRGAMRP